MERALGALRLRIEPLERIVEKFAESLVAPRLVEYSGGQGFRYDNPDVRHFCLLKAARMVSALNASIELAKGGYAQEVAILIRTLIECGTLIEFVLDLNDAEDHKKLVDKYLTEFFADNERGEGAAVRKAQVPQGVVHDRLGKTLDEIAEAVEKTEGRTPAAQLYRSVYRVYSNYVHPKYPESMDLYGGRPGHFHLRGMSATPKDLENVEQIATHIESACNSFIIMIQQLYLYDIVDNDPVAGAWYRERMES
jgi:hypothetical protein